MFGTLLYQQGMDIAAATPAAPPTPETPSRGFLEGPVLLGIIAFGVVVLWDTPVIYPLKILVVFFHEISHALAALLTGGDVEHIEVVAQEGGLAYTRGGSRFVILTAGYLGSLLWGALILLVASRTRWDRALSIALGLLMAFVTLWLVRPILSFGFGFGTVTAAAMVGLGLKLPERLNDLVLRTIGLTSCLYAVLDIKSDILDRPGISSDAKMLADLTGIPTLFWGGLWLLVALGLTIYLVRLALKRPSAHAIPARPTIESPSR